MSNIVVIGCGVIGLTTALQLQKDIKNARVTIIAEKLSPNTTGDISAGLWGPYLLGGTPECDIIKWSKITHDKFFRLWKNGLASSAGICLIPATRFKTEDTPYEEPSWLSIPFGKYTLTKEQLAKINKQFNKNYSGGTHYVTFTCEPTKFLPFLLEEFFENGGNLILRKINSFNELIGEYDVIVNCTGPGAKDLAKDDQMHMIRGQVTRVKAPYQFHVLQDESNDGNYIIPNTSVVILGGTHQVNDTNLSPDPIDKNQIINGCIQMSPCLKSSTEINDGVGLRPGRSMIRLETEKHLTGSNKILNIVHNYGHGGAGVTLCFGCAEDASSLVQSIILSKLQSHL